MNRRVVFLLFGIDEVFTELHFHLLRFLATNRPEDIGIVIYTDKPERFDRWKATNLQFEVIPTSMEQIETWRGPAHYFWRAKIMMISDALDRFGGSIVYCDTDTYPRGDLTPLFEKLEAGATAMAEKEGVIDRRVNPEFWHFDKHFAAHPDFSMDGRTFHVPLTTPIWNAGVVGVNQNRRDTLADALTMSDTVYEQWPFIFVEQFSLGYMFEHSPDGCVAASDQIFHYWPVRRYSVLLDRFFDRYGNSPIQEQIDRSERILAEYLAPAQEAWGAKRPFQWLWARYPYTMKKFFKKQWPIEDHFGLVDSDAS